MSRLPESWNMENTEWSFLVRAVHLLDSAESLGDLNSADKNVIVQCLKHAKLDWNTSWNFEHYVMCNPMNLDKFIEAMMTLRRKLFSLSLFLDKAHETMKTMTEQNLPRPDLFKMGCTHSLQMGPSFKWSRP